jgi:RNA polymerase sigma factor (sigma-70 family)
METEASGRGITAMGQAVTTSVVRQLESLFTGGSVAGLSDRQLIERFVTGRDSLTAQAAFAAIVARHGSMVLGICRQLLGDYQRAEDAFQAVFLVLARRARSIRDPDRLSNWLYGVALRTAREARTQLARMRQNEEDRAVYRPEAVPTPPADRSAIEREQAEALHEEVDRLPESARLPVVLCYFEGLTLAEAADRLRCPAGTVHSRLDRARERLRRALVRRGVVLSGAALAGALSPRSASASIPPLLCDSTTRAAITFAARHAGVGGALSAPAAALAQEVLHTMLIHKLRLIVMTVLALAAITTGAGYLTRSLAMKEEPVKDPATPVAKVAPQAADGPKPTTKSDPATPARMTVTGRVLDPDGKPVKGAFVDLVAAERRPWVGASEEDEQATLLGQGQSDGDGRYRLDVPRTTSSRVHGIAAMAAAPGYAAGMAILNPDAEQPVADIRLQPEQIVRARLMELTGAPAKGVEVHTWQGAHLPKGLRAGPPPVIKADDQGRIELTGIASSSNITLHVRDMRYARQDLHIDSTKATPSQEVTLVLQPARIIEGRVLAADTGQPIPNAVVSALTWVRTQYAAGGFTSKFRADAQGRYIMNPIAGDTYTMSAFPTGGEPYLIPQEELKWTKGAVKMTHDIRMPRGVLIRGKVTEAGTNRPLAASSIQYMPMRASGRDGVMSGWGAIVATREDGTFQIAVAPGKGHLLIHGPSGDYILGEIGSNTLYSGQPGGMRNRAHAVIPYEVKAGDPPHEVATTLRPGVTIKGRVEGPDGQTITDGFIVTTLIIEAQAPFWRGDYQVPIRDGRFELHGLDPKGTTRVYVLDPQHEWGATVDLSGKQTGEDLTIRLQPCGQARARFVGPDGQPVAGYQPAFEFVATPGPNRTSFNEHDRTKLSADADLAANVDRKHHWNLPRTDANGGFTMVSLIPGALYRINDMSTNNDATKGIQLRKDFTVKPGQTLDLGDILIEKPRE